MLLVVWKNEKMTNGSRRVEWKLPSHDLDLRLQDLLGHLVVPRRWTRLERIDITDCMCHHCNLGS